ncbi:MAG: hypothetical protein IJX70_03775, partial [Clostridia bacterium]|nr:hypothetical protein [Clostridia bacterium]
MRKINYNNLLKKFCILLFAFCICASGAVAASAAEDDACASTTDCTGTYANGFCTVCGGYQPAVQNEDVVYEISNAGQLYWFAAVVNGGYGDVGQNTWANVVLTENITINTGVLKADGSLNTGTFTEWTPIGNYSADTSPMFFGTFDGNGKTVSGIYINGTSNYQGLFGRVDGTVKNVTVLDSYIKGGSYVGGVVGLNVNGFVQNCHNSGAVIGTEWVGGVVGNNSYGTVQNCYNTGAVSGTYYYLGGVVGSNENGTVQNCYNTGAVSGTYYYLGGVVGYNLNGTVQNCYNTGVVSGTSQGGGVVGGNNSGTVANCYFLQTTDINVGLSGIGDPDDTGVSSNEGAAPMTADQFKSGEVAYLLNGDQSTIVFMQTLGTDDYPNFTGAKVYYGYNSCTETATKIYTNDSTVSAEKPHSGGTAT